MNKTLDYYNKNAKVFVDGTKDVAFHEMQDKFLGLLPEGAAVLDFGCGSGRDTKYFLERGYKVDAIDGSEELCKIASDYAGISVKPMLFNELRAENQYDGIWACASILHLPKDELKEVFGLMVKALKSKGIIYTSFKYGQFEGMRNGRYFTDFTEENFRSFIKDIEGITIQDTWMTGDVRPGRGNEKWLNLILMKTN